MILTIAIVSAGVTLLVEGAKYVAKKTRTKYDDQVVAFIADHADAIIQYVIDKHPAPPVPRAREIYHRVK